MRCRGLPSHTIATMGGGGGDLSCPMVVPADRNKKKARAKTEGNDNESTAFHSTQIRNIFRTTQEQNSTQHAIIFLQTFEAIRGCPVPPSRRRTQVERQNHALKYGETTEYLLPIKLESIRNTQPAYSPRVRLTTLIRITTSRSRNGIEKHKIK